MAHSGYVAIAGRPNAGKSTLLNKILGTALSISTPKAQTTRERVHGILTEKLGQIVFIDTPGIHRAKEGGINAYMMAEVRGALDSPDAVWYLVDPASHGHHEIAVLELLQEIKNIPVFLIYNKCDLKRSIEQIPSLDQEIMKEAGSRGVTFKKVIQLSALKNRGVEELLAETWKVIPEGELHYPDPDQLSDRPTKFFVSEKIREQLYLKLGEELPYSCAIEIVKFDEKAKPPRIEALIHVERDSQKGIVVGAGGKKIKEIGTAARREIEEFLGEKIFLGLNVKVLKDWSKDRQALERLGYALPGKKSGRRA